MASENFDDKNRIVLAALNRIPGPREKRFNEARTIEDGNHRGDRHIRDTTAAASPSPRPPKEPTATSFAQISALHQPAHENHRSPHPPNPHRYVAHHGHIGLGNNDLGRRRKSFRTRAAESRLDRRVRGSLAMESLCIPIPQH